MELDEMKSLFDIEVGPNLEKEDEDYEVSVVERKMIENKSVVPFDKQCQNIKASMSEEVVVSPPPPLPMKKEEKVEKKEEKVEKKVDKKIDDNELITNAIKETAKKVTPPAINFDEPKSKEEEIPGDALMTDQVMDIEDENDEDEDEEESEEKDQISKARKKVLAALPDPEPVNYIDPNNPLGLDGTDFKAYQMIKDRYPQFSLFDGSVAYREFYQWKLTILKQVLTRFPVLDIASNRQEARDTNLDHFVGEQILSPELLRKKIDDVYRHRVRLATLLAQAYEQFPAWKRSIEMLRAKLFKDHDVRGSHKRDGIVLEHIRDVEFYVKELEGFIDSAKVIYSVLDAAAESLSRQLACIVTREATGVDLPQEKETVKEKKQVAVAQPVKKSNSVLDDLDGIPDGTVVPKPTGSILVEKEWSVMSDDDPLSKIG